MKRGILPMNVLGKAWLSLLLALALSCGATARSGAKAIDVLPGAFGEAIDTLDEMTRERCIKYADLSLQELLEDFERFERFVEGMPPAGYLQILQTTLLLPESLPSGATEVERAIWAELYADAACVVSFVTIDNSLNWGGVLYPEVTGLFEDYAVRQDGSVEHVSLRGIRSQFFADPVVPGVRVINLGSHCNGIYTHTASSVGNDAALSDSNKVRNDMLADQTAFYGCWYAVPYRSAGSGSISGVSTGSGGALYDTRWLLNMDGTFVYGCDETDGLDRIRYTAGNWYVEGDKLYLEIGERLVWEGGEEVPATGSIRTMRMIENPTIRLISYDEPEREAHDIAGPLSPEELGGLETAGRKVIEIDGQAFYGFGSHEGLLDGFWEMKKLADPIVKEAGVPLFEYLADPALTAFAINFEEDFPASVSVRHDGEASGRPVTVTDPETVRAVFEALRQITVLGEWPVSGHTDDYLYYYFDMAISEEIYGFEFQDGMLLDGGLGLHEITGFDALRRALPDPGF